MVPTIKGGTMTEPLQPTGCYPDPGREPGMAVEWLQTGRQSPFIHRQ
jgi:hypothetical protein